MSSTNSSNRLTLLSYATFNHHIPIHDHSWRQHHWKQTETMVALASLVLQRAKKLFQKARARSVVYWFLHVLGTLPIFPGDISLDIET